MFEPKNRMFTSLLLLFLTVGSFARVSNSETVQFKENKTDVGTFVQIPPGEVVMGLENGLDGEKPVHKVRITKPFEIGKYEVTQEQWQAVMGNNPSHFKGADMPVEMVSCNEIQDFIIKLNAKRMMGTSIGCRRKRNGSMRAEREAREILREDWMRWLGMTRTPAASRIP